MAKAVVSQDGRVHMLDDSGTPVTVDRSELAKAVGAGFTLETPESVEQRAVAKERGTLGQQALTAVEAGVSGATLGLSDAAAVAALGDDYRQAALERRQVNPLSATVGNVVGTVAPLIASGGSSLLARGGAALGAPVRGAAALGSVADDATMAALKAFGYQGTSALGRAAARGTALGAAGATEGALYGLGQSVSDAALGGTDWTAEKALAAMETGALYGLGGGAAIGGLGSALGSAGRSVVERMSGGKSFREAVKDFAEKRAFKAVTGNAKKFYDRATNFGAQPERLQRIGRKMLDNGVPLSGNIDEIARATTARADEASGRLQAIAAQSEDVVVDARAILSRLDEQKAKIDGVALGSYKKVGKKLESEIAPFRAAIEEGQELTFPQLWELRKNVDRTINWASAKQSPATDALRDMRATLDDALTASLENPVRRRTMGAANDNAFGEAANDVAAPSPLAGQWRAAKEDYSDYALVRDAAQDQAERIEKNRFYSPSDQGWGGLAMLSSVATGNVGALGGMAMGAAVGAGHKLIRERGAGTIARLADAVASLEQRTNGAARVLAGLDQAKRLPARASASYGVEQFEGVQTQLQQFVSDPDRATTILAEQLHDVGQEQPELATAMGVRLVGDMQYLASQLPPQVTRASHSFTPQAEKPLVPAVQKPALVRKAKALANPAEVISGLAAGKVDWDGVQALKDRRPELFQDLRMKVMEYTAERGDALPYHRRIMLSLAFDFTGDESLEPATFAAIQQSAAPPPPPGPPPGGGGAPSGELAASMQTPSQESTNVS
jgi:hypothetical protein